MSITDEDRSRVGELTMRAFDAMDEYGEEVKIEDAVVLFEVSFKGEDGETYTELVSRTTSHRSTVAGGIAQAYANVQLSEFVDDRSLEDDED